MVNLLIPTSSESRNGSTTARSCSDRSLTSAVTCMLLNTQSVCNNNNNIITVKGLTCEIAPATASATTALQEVDFKQHVREPTHVGVHILDHLVITQNIHNIISSASIATLLTDHHVIRCDLVTGKPKRPRRQIRYRKYMTINHNAKLVSDLRNSDLFNNPNDGVNELYHCCVD